MATSPADTPLMKQYDEIKRRHPDTLLLFRVGDFYETFSDDAVQASRILKITLTRRGNGYSKGMPLAGFPYHALDTYLPRLVRAGLRVAICEQLEDPSKTKKLVKRGITELVTPGLSMNDNVLTAGANNWAAAVAYGRRGSVGVAFLDISTGEFLCGEGDRNAVDKLMAAMMPSEVVVMRGEKERVRNDFRLKVPLADLDDWVFTLETARKRLLDQFGTKTLKGFGLDGMEDAVTAAGAMMHYLDATEHTQTDHITGLRRIDQSRYVRMDGFTVRNLEIIAPLVPEGSSLFSIIDRTQSPGGTRMLRRWLLFPLTDVAAIRKRQHLVALFMEDSLLRTSAAALLQETGDPQRAASRTAAGRVGPRELRRLGEALAAMARMKTLLEQTGDNTAMALADGIDPLEDLSRRITESLVEDPPALPSAGGMIAAGVDSRLDEMRALLGHNKEALAAIQAREMENTGIPSLKLGFNNVYGYYMEVRNTHRDKVPQGWTRKQTLVGAERYITPELKDYEQRILQAQESIGSLESSLYNALVEETKRYVGAIGRNAALIAEADCFLSMALAAIDLDYVRPEVDDSQVIDIEKGRHPVIERMLPAGERYVANSVRLDSDGEQIWMITGPNMSGKSALLRQTALITLLAQTGSCVPAGRARIGVADKIFTRVGATDNISRGESTFMVEMTEAAAILNNMTARSLILFDELGRGTSTYDGISIAWAIVENIHENGVVRPRTLFATHYHELNEMAKRYDRVANYNVSVSEENGKVVFLRTLVPGGSAHSFGIHVARLAGMPPAIVKRADEVLEAMERETRGKEKSVGKAVEKIPDTIFALDDPLLNEIRDRILGTDIDNLTPLQALQLLNTLKNLLTGH